MSSPTKTYDFLSRFLFPFFSFLHSLSLHILSLHLFSALLLSLHLIYVFTQGSKEILAQHGSYVKALFDVFPNIGLIRSRFKSKLPSMQTKMKHQQAIDKEQHKVTRYRRIAETKLLIGKYWDDTKNQRSFMMSFAQDKGFDPLVPTNWYSVSTESFLALRVRTQKSDKNNNKTTTKETKWK